MMFTRVVYHLRSKVQLYYISSKTQNLKQLPARYQFPERRKHRLLNVLRTSPNPSLALVLFHRFLFLFVALSLSLSLYPFPFLFASISFLPVY